ncbi:MAG: hypothetical protein KDK90_24040 [Leptospiraceae bacterium]|nr:hypothetical protein [Leptospiraceae bacterium]
MIALCLILEIPSIILIISSFESSFVQVILWEVFGSYGRGFGDWLYAGETHFPI